MRVLKAFFFLLLAAGVFGAGYFYRAKRGDAAESGGRRILYYVDPMNPAIVFDKPGIAPCGMPRKPVYADEVGKANETASKKVLYYEDPQAKTYRSDKPGINPETGNDLTPVYKEEAPSVHIPLDKQQLIGVKTTLPEWSSETQSITAQGKVTLDERRQTKVHSRVEGWIEKVYADFTGKQVEKGQPLVTIYSPEMVASQQELLLAARARKLMSASTLPSAKHNGDTLFDAARRRLEQWELSGDDIDQVLKTGEPIRNYTVYSPASGYITERTAYPKAKTSPEMSLYTIADLSRVWIIADIFESDAAAIKPGMTGAVNVSYLSGRAFSARVAYIQPELDAMTRTLKVRLEADNPNLQLKPEMFVTVSFRLAGERRLTIPGDAVIDTGDRQLVYVDRGEGHFEPRIVTGERRADRFAIQTGLRPNERVVSSGAFLVDSESQMRSVRPK